MAGRAVAVVLAVVMTGTVGVMAKCTKSSTPDVPPGTGNAVWLYVFRILDCVYHSGIGTQGSYWSYGPGHGVSRHESYEANLDNKELAKWYRLGRTNKSKEEVLAIVDDLKTSCYPGHSKCKKFTGSNYNLFKWNCNYFTHHFAEALGMADNYPAWLWNRVPGLNCVCDPARGRMGVGWQAMAEYEGKREGVDGHAG